MKRLKRKDRSAQQLVDVFDAIIPDNVTDSIERSLWELKAAYDLPTEEVADVVYSKRKNFDYIREKNKK